MGDELVDSTFKVFSRMPREVGRFFASPDLRSAIEAIGERGCTLKLRDPWWGRAGEAELYVEFSSDGRNVEDLGATWNLATAAVLATLRLMTTS